MTVIAEYNPRFECRHSCRGPRSHIWNALTISSMLATNFRCNYMFTLLHFTTFGENKQAAVPIKVLRGEVADRFGDWPANSTKAVTTVNRLCSFHRWAAAIKTLAAAPPAAAAAAVAVLRNNAPSFSFDPTITHISAGFRLDTQSPTSHIYGIKARQNSCDSSRLGLRTTGCLQVLLFVSKHFPEHFPSRWWRNFQLWVKLYFKHTSKWEHYSSASYFTSLTLHSTAVSSQWAASGYFFWFRCYTHAM